MSCYCETMLDMQEAEIQSAVNMEDGFRQQLFLADTDDNQPVIQPDQHLVDELTIDCCAGGQADVMVHMNSTKFDYSHLPDSNETPPTMAGLTKVRVNQPQVEPHVRKDVFVMA
jgi:hypothetical protein